MSDTMLYKIDAKETPWAPFSHGDMPLGHAKLVGGPHDTEHEFPVSGLWRGGPADLPNDMRTYDVNETIYIIEGRLRIDYEDGTAVEAAAGDVLSFKKGVRVKWTILSDMFEEFFIYT